MILSFAMERELIPQLSHYYTSEMEDRPLSPRLYHLLIREQRSNESTGISLRPILTDGCGSRAFSGHNSAGLNTPLSPLSANPDLTASPHSQSQHGSIRRSVSPTSVSFHLSSEEIPTPNRRTNSILSLLNGPMSSSPPSFIGPSNSFTHKTEQDKYNHHRPNSPYPRPPPATFPITQHNQSTYFEERPCLPPTPGSIETYNPAPSSFPEFYPYHTPTVPYMTQAIDRPGIYRRHSSHPNEHHSLYPHLVPPSLHRHSTHHSSSATPSTSFNVPFPPPPPLTAYANGPYEPDFRVSGPRIPISRTTKACNSCRNRKVRCDAGAMNGGRAGEAPCTRCKEGNLECVYTNVQKKRGPCPGTARPAGSRSRRSSVQKQQQQTLIPQPPLPPSRPDSMGTDYGNHLDSVSPSQRSSIASIQTSIDVITPEETKFGHVGSYGFPFPPASSSALSQEYDWHATSKAAVAGNVPGWSGPQVGPRGSYSSAPWEGRR
ncbi:hypothetical protein C347_00760 [Cryptococcus neoformans AD2-60a]|nr:hypothetical protein C347_00760 [Cryptococcus neoformans var. grubii AD2-60a]OXC86885.1 hypothetical protein C344_00691 [Cryptococcus neoformans var. grubii AD1-7a]OXH39162.1 hypothetical protein J005_00690 [Cryptococcus neoformans var. grubii]